jgi:ferric-dicitrate binding protein FerR (iron transport regulator)
MATATAPAPYRTPRAVRRALTVVAAVIALVFVFWGTINLLQLLTRHTTTEVETFRDVTALLVEDSSDITLTSAPAGAPL